jgi:hypothetical protein
MILTSFSSQSLALDLNHPNLGSHIDHPSEAFDSLLTALPVQILVDRSLNGE